MFSRLLCLGVLAVLVAAPGCAKERESGPKLTGRVLVDGQPCRPASVNDFDLKFLTAEGVGPGKRSYLAEVQPDGTFTLNGSIGKGIPTGRYLDRYSETKTPLEVEISDASREVTVDLERKMAVVS